MLARAQGKAETRYGTLRASRRRIIALDPPRAPRTARADLAAPDAPLARQYGCNRAGTTGESLGGLALVALATCVIDMLRSAGVGIEYEALFVERARCCPFSEEMAGASRLRDTHVNVAG